MTEPTKPLISQPVLLLVIGALVTALIGMFVSGATRLAETSVAHDGTLREMQADRRNIADRLAELLALTQRMSERVETMRDEQSALVGRVTIVERSVNQLEKRVDQLSTSDHGASAKPRAGGKE